MTTINDMLLAFFDKDKVDSIIAEEFAGPPDAVSSMWYVRVLIGASAWLASLSFLAATFMLLGNVEKAGIFVGIVLCAGAGILNYFYQTKVFVRQFALALCLAGQAAATIYFFDSSHSTASTCIFSVVVSIILFVAYQYSVMRFIAVQSAVISVIILMEDTGSYFGLSVLIILLAIAAAIVWLRESELVTGSMAAWFSTAAYAVSFSLLFVPVLSTHDFLTWKSPDWMPATAGVALVFIFTQGYIFVSFNKKLASPAFIAASLLTISFAGITHNAPGIITALFVMTIGFFRGSRIVTALAGLFLGAYIIMFYYNLGISLLFKSYILMGSGALLIASWGVFARYQGGLQK